MAVHVHVHVHVHASDVGDRMLRLVRAIACVAAIAAIAAGTVRAGAPRRFALAVHAIEGVPPAFLEERIANANRLFAAADVAFALRSTTTLDPSHATLTTREDRDALGALHTRGAIDVFVVASLVDVDTPPLPRRGVHWRDRTRPGVRYVIVIATSGPWVLAHELGHYFGNGHSTVRGNLMSYERGEGDPFLDATQLRRIRSAARHQPTPR